MIIKDFFEKLNSEGIDYAVLRGYEELPYDFSNDIDLYVNPGHLDSVIQIFESVATLNLCCICDFNAKFEFLSMTVTENDRAIKFDIWTGFKYHGFEYLSNWVVEANREKFNGLCVLNRDVECLLTTSKEILHTGCLVKRKRDKLIAKVGNNWQPKALLKHRAHGDYASRLLYEEDCRKVKKLRRLYFTKIIASNISDSVVSTILSCVKFLTNHFKSKRAISHIAFVGPDGSGKTTFYYELEKTLSNLKNVKAIHYYHGRPEIIPELKKFNIFSFVTNRAISKNVNSECRSAEKSLRSRMLNRIYMLYYLADYMLFSAIKVKDKFTSSISVFDRYYYDYFISNPDPRVFDKILMFFYKYFTPSPGLVVFLYSPAETIFARKPELTLHQIGDQQSRIILLQKQNYFERLVTIHTHDPSTVAQITRSNKIIKSLIFMAL